MTTIDYQTESVRYGLKALVADLEHEKRHADAMHALRLNDGNVKRQTLDRLDSFIVATRGRGITYKALTA